MPPSPTARLRGMCARLPGAEESTSFGHPAFRVGKKTFAVLDEYHGVACLCFKVAPGLQRMLVEDARYFAAPYGAKHGWTCVRVDARTPWRDAAALVRESWRLCAPKRLLGERSVLDEKIAYTTVQIGVHLTRAITKDTGWRPPRARHDDVPAHERR